MNDFEQAWLEGEEPDGSHEAGVRAAEQARADILRRQLDEYEQGHAELDATADSAADGAPNEEV